MDLGPLRVRMRSLNMSPREEDGSIVGEVRFQQLVNAFSRAAIPSAGVRSYDETRIIFTSPPHLTHLPALKLEGLPTPRAFEMEVHRLYRRRLEKTREAGELLRTLHIPIEFDEPGFRVAGRLRMGRGEVVFAVRDGRTLQVVSLDETPVHEVEPKDRRIVVAKDVTSAAEVEIALDPVVKRLRAYLAKKAAPPPEAQSPFLSSEAEVPTEEHQIRLRHAKANVQSKFDFGFGELTEPGMELSDPGQFTGGNINNVMDDVPTVAVVCDKCRSIFLAQQYPGQPEATRCPRCLRG